MLIDFKKHIEKNFSNIIGKKLLICVSSGVDSMVLLKLFQNLNYNISVAHCNFKLRDDESDADADFIKNYCKSNNITFHYKEFNTNIPNNSIQMSARKLRYEWFHELSTTYKINYILTGHHLEDSLETFLINISRSTGLEGLLGIKEENYNVVRPLLTYSKNQLIEYAKQSNLKWREDSSNSKSDYLRNKFRNNIVPLLLELNPEFIKNFSNTISYLKKDNLIIEQVIDDFKKKHFKSKPNVIQIKKHLIKSLDQNFIFRLFKKYGFKNSNEIFDLCFSSTGKIIHSKKYSLLSDRENLLLKKNNNKKIENFFYNNSTDFTLPDNIKIEEGDFNERLDNSLYLDKKNINFPITIRRWIRGDYIYPTGMKGKKLISKIFKDKKLSKYEKEEQLIVEDCDHILWLVGIRFDKRKYNEQNLNFKISKIDK